MVGRHTLPANGANLAYLNEADVRAAARSDYKVIAKSMDSARVLAEAASVSLNETFDVFLCHAVRDAEIVQGAKVLLERQGLKVYVDWIVDPEMDRSAVTAGTADILRQRMRKSRSLLYLFSANSRRSRWMPWELGFFDGFNGTVGILPIRPTTGALDFSQEEYLDLYPKVELQDTGIWVNRTKDLPVPGTDGKNFSSFRTWTTATDKLRPAS